MNAFYLLLGAFLLAITIVDLLWTTLWVDGGAGPLSVRLTTGLWWGMQKLSGMHSRLLSIGGPFILMATLLMWIALVWAGWTFVFAGAEEALLGAHDKEPASWVGRFYFVGYAMFTMGNGDFTPNGGFWQVATGLTTSSGMLFVTMGVSYVLSVLSAVVEKRSFARSVTGLGESSEEILETAWNGTNFHTLDLPLNGFSAALSTLADQHKAYPILHYYHSERGNAASGMAVTILDEALTILRRGVPEERRPNAVIVEGVRSSAQDYIRTLNKAFIEPADEPPPLPDLDRLRAAGIPVASDADFEAAVADLTDRRRKLLGMVRADAWHWPPVQTDS
jgi:hypothetical protein